MRFQCSQCGAVNECSAADQGVLLACGRCATAQAAPSHAVARGSVLGDFVLRDRVRERLGASDYAATQLSLDRHVVLKIVDPELSSNERFVAAFLHAAKSASQLSHPSLAHIYAIGGDQGLVFLAREFLEGEPLNAVLRREGHLELATGVTLFIQAAEALSQAWRHRQLLHGNLKPDYLHLTPYGVLKLLDVGLAGLDPAEEVEEIKGSAGYLPPERIRGEALDQRADLYSLGVTFFEALTGHPPFTSEQPLDVIRQHLSAKPPPPQRFIPSLPLTVNRVLDQLLAKDPNERYATPALFADDLRRLQQALPTGAQGSNGRWPGLQSFRPGTSHEIKHPAREPAAPPGPPPKTETSPLWHATHPPPGLKHRGGT